MKNNTNLADLINSDTESSFDLDELPVPALRKQNAVTSNRQNQVFIDAETQEIVAGNLDLNHSSNKNLKNAKIPWQSGQCTPYYSYLNNLNKDNNDKDPDPDGTPMPVEASC
ncbi:hypothetical protein L3V82_04020 [Thiotrichales bacterium 19S3-7]|nr:hypothetical protein [Thiotrichales bacterium 19S3-7]MCF6801841.1 hypothetical protein [Thiotrichales bacterium 19S3-11]